MVRINYKNFKIYTEQGNLICYNRLFRKPVNLSNDILRKMFLVKKKKEIKIFKLNNFFFSFFKNYNSINLYKGNKFIIFRLKKFFLFQKFGTFIATRVLESGKNLHLRKKNIKKKK